MILTHVHISTIIIVFCSDPCTENEVQLNNGVVEVCHDAQWGLVCVHRYSWNLRAAEVVCSQVGIPSRSQLYYRASIKLLQSS